MKKLLKEMAGMLRNPMIVYPLGFKKKRTKAQRKNGVGPYLPPEGGININTGGI